MILVLSVTFLYGNLYVSIPRVFFLLTSYQVRYLDAHLRWRDLVLPEESPDGNGSVVDAITSKEKCCHSQQKGIAENKMSYAHTVAVQRSLPLSLMKNILKTEKTRDMNKFSCSLILDKGV